MEGRRGGERRREVGRKMELPVLLLVYSFRLLSGMEIRTEAEGLKVQSSHSAAAQ